MKKTLIKKAHLIGPFLFLLTLVIPMDLERDQQNFLAIFLLVVANWLFSSTPLYITGLLGVSLTTLLGVTTAREALQHLFNPIIQSSSYSSSRSSEFLISSSVSSRCSSVRVLFSACISLLSWRI